MYCVITVAGVTFRWTLGVIDWEEESKGLPLFLGIFAKVLFNAVYMASFAGSFAFWLMLMDSMFFAN